MSDLDDPVCLIAKVLYGCGLRLFECLNLRVQCFNFDAGILTVHDGKGQKDRTVGKKLGRYQNCHKDFGITQLSRELSLYLRLPEYGINNCDNFGVYTCSEII